jgi:hypothetical protein
MPLTNAARATPAAARRDPQIDRLGGAINQTTTIVPISAASLREFLVSEFRRMSARLLLAKTVCDSIGVALKDGMIEPADAIQWLDEIDPELLDLIHAPKGPAS